MMLFDYVIGILIVALLGIIINSIKILREYERGVIFLLGRFWKVKGPGLIIVVPVVQQMVRVDLRVIVMDVPTQDVISRDNVSVKVNAVVYFRVIDPEKAIIQVERFLDAVSQLAQTTLRSVLGQHELDDMLAERDALNHDIQNILDRQTDAWGIKISNVEIKHVDLDESMVRAIAAQAEAERQRRLAEQRKNSSSDTTRSGSSVAVNRPMPIPTINTAAAATGTHAHGLCHVLYHGQQGLPFRRAELFRIADAVQQLSQIGTIER